MRVRHKVMVLLYRSQLKCTVRQNEGRSIMK